MSDRDSITQAILDQQAANPLDDTAQTMEYPALDAAALMQSGALRVVQNPMGDPNDPSNYSIVTPYNDTHPNNPTASWVDKPASYGAAQLDLANPKSGALYDGKYRQILRGKGMP